MRSVNIKLEGGEAKAIWSSLQEFPLPYFQRVSLFMW